MLSHLVHAFVEMTKNLLQQPGVKFLLNERFCQDPVEAFFGKQCACGGRSDNPTVKQFIDNTVSPSPRLEALDHPFTVCHFTATVLFPGTPPQPPSDFTVETAGGEEA